MRVYGYVERGIGKNISEDSIMIGNGIISEGYITWECTDDVCVLAVADGVGGNEAGEEASLMALEGLREAELFLGCDEEKIRSSIQQINKGIIGLSQSNSKFDRMATTLTGVVLMQDHSYLFHIGNTRCYVINNGRFLYKLTEDMTKVQDYVNQGLMTKAEAAESLENNVINACLGAGTETMAERLEVVDKIDKTKIDKPLLFTSDGVHDYVSADDMEEALASSDDIEIKIRTLADMARNAGSEDDISIIYVERNN